jgi:hypothetical protein
LSRIYNFAKLLFLKNNIKKIFKDNDDYLYLLNSLKTLNSDAKNNSKKNIFTKSGIV